MQYLPYRSWSAEKVALHFRAANCAKSFLLLLRLDAFGSRDHVEAVGKANDRSHDRQGVD
jgi:hypothetical protein